MKPIILRENQVGVLNNLRGVIRDGFRKPVLSAPTGYGKTILLASMLQSMYQKGKRGIFVCDRISLIAQTSAVLDAYDIPHGIIQGGNWRYRPHERIQIASAQTLARRSWPDADLVIIDEAHSLHKTITDYLARTDAICIGATATPFTKGLGQHYNAIVSAETTFRLIEAGYLSNYRVFAASEPDMTGAKVVAGEWSDDVAAERAMPIVGDCVAEYCKHAAGRKFIAFGCNVAHCEELQRQFMAAGVQTELYTYRTDDEARTAMVEEFRKPDSFIRGLISVSALSKGFDVPDVTCIIMARPLKSSLSEHIQILGRGLRSHPDKTDCIVLDHAGNMMRFWDEMNEFFEHGAHELDDGVKKPAKAKKKGEKEGMKCPQCKCVHTAAASCPECGHVYPRRANSIEHAAGQLTELTGGNATKEDKQRIFSELLWLAESRKYSSGWVGHNFKAKFGSWPRGLVEMPIMPSPATISWIRSRNIAFSKQAKRA
jgi:superfamily II DNA or RNA helicase